MLDRIASGSSVGRHASARASKYACNSELAEARFTLTPHLLARREHESGRHARNRLYSCLEVRFHLAGETKITSYKRASIFRATTRLFNNVAVNVESDPFLPVASRPSGDFDDDGEVESADNGENFVYRELKCSIESKRELS